ncbi:MAG: CinA family protein [Gammaproteobacteria bacterium]|nr:CinA family protein [Gammaproteobacteria bacterium]MDX2458511.1 CinA family protein [Gammaproteobacteria bacterium]
MAQESSDAVIDALANRVGEALSARGFMLATAESCTGGWASMAVTAVAGSSAWFERGFVTYSNAAKQEMLGVRPKTLLRDGVVSEAVVVEMAAGALIHSQADISVAISGIAGPGGAVPGKPVGTVCFSWAVKGQSHHKDTKHFEGDREAVRLQSVMFALQGLLDVLGKA